RFPYKIIFEMIQNEVVVLAVAHGSRRPNYWLKRRSSTS
ncbi:MAG: type II toxin-antitoxin system RelE/ParE family toxin, partial [Planctomycetota bacterium]